MSLPKKSYVGDSDDLIPSNSGSSELYMEEAQQTKYQ
jgi:hypothetical protein